MLRMCTGSNRSGLRKLNFLSGRTKLRKAASSCARRCFSGCAMTRTPKTVRSKDRRKKLCSEERETLQATSLRKLGDLMQHTPRFLKIVNDAKSRVKETTVDEVKQKLDDGEKFLLVDVREESEFAKDHLPGAIHLGKGVIERDIETRVPDEKTPMILYCGGGFRSAMAADNLHKMGYTNVLSMDGGVRGWRGEEFYWYLGLGGLGGGGEGGGEPWAPLYIF